eukprot:COSAG05_NODE_2299_length_3258_cov_2.988382_4_plen_87_part_00
MLVYSGDVDNCLPYTGSLQWVQRLGLKETEAWRPWTVDGGRRMGGYVVTFGGGQLEFVTVLPTSFQPFFKLIIFADQHLLLKQMTP